jgi:DNA recombination protein RmuC
VGVLVVRATASLEKFQQAAKGDLEARQKAVDALVQPIRESLQQVDGKLGEMEKTRESAYSALNEQLRGLVETHLPMLRSETSNLVKALRQPTVRGRWGEIQLKRVVEMAGMVDHCDFFEQQSSTTEDGRLRPDLIVKLPGGKQIIIDAKAPVAAYLEAAEATDDAARQVHLARHAQQVRTHMTALGRKAYWDTFSPSPEFVIMFLPGEMFFSAALQEDPALIEFGVNEKVVPATPTTLIALLRAVAYGWRQEALALNAEEVAQLGKQLYERIATLAGHWSDVGQRLGKAVDAYNKSAVTLESRVLVSARRFAELKAAPEEEIEVAQQIEATPRALQAPEVVVRRLEAMDA